MDPKKNTPQKWMRRCLELARRGAGTVSPNPLVGCILVSEDGMVLGEGWHERFGEAHAEVNAIAAAEAKHGAAALRSATLYVNLEPCCHVGKTPPCAALVLEKRIPRVVVGMVDPNPVVGGRGIAQLEAAGVQVTVGVEAEACWRLNEAFAYHLQTGRPLVTLKMAQTLDGFVATDTGDSRWVSGGAARERVHRWRATLDGVLVGSGTARMDDPALTVRHVIGRQPIRVVLDRTGTLPQSLQLFTDQYAEQTLAIVGAGRRPLYAEALQQAGGRVWAVPETEQGLDLALLLDRLGQEGGRAGTPLQSLLVEAGPGLSTALLQQDLVDRYALFIAPKLLGAGLPTHYSLWIQQMAHARTFAASAWEQVGNDMLFMGYRHRYSPSA